MSKEEFDKKFARLFCMWADAFIARDLDLQKTIVKMEQKLLTQYMLMR